MDNIQHYDPTAPVNRFSSAVRFCQVNLGAEPVACAGRRARATHRPAKMSEALTDGECPNAATVSTGEENATLQSRKSTTDHIESPHLSRTADSGDNPVDDSNNLANKDDNSDNHDSLHGLFSTELNLTDTESSLEDGITRLDKGVAGNPGPVSERLRVGDSPDIPIVLSDDVSPVNTSGLYSLRGSEQEPEAHRGFDERIPILLQRNPISNPFDSDRPPKPRQKLAGPRAGERAARGKPVAIKNSKRSPKKRAAPDRTLHDESVKRRKRPGLFTAITSDSSDSENEITSVDVPRLQSNGGRSRPSLKSTVFRADRGQDQISDQTTPRTKKQQRSTYWSSSDESHPSSEVMDPGRTLSPQPSCSRRKFHPLSDRSTGESSGEENTTPPKARSNSNRDDRRLADPEEVVWEHGRLLSYKIVNGKPYVLVPWLPTWESAEEYSKEEVARVKQRFESRTKPKQRARPPVKARGGVTR